MRIRFSAVSIALLSLGFATEGPKIGNGAELLAQAPNRSRLVDRIGKEPRACMYSRPGYEICAWLLRARDGRWAEFANVLGTDRQVSIVCEFPASGAARSQESCRVYARVALSYDDALRQVSGALDVASPPAASSRVQQAQRTLDAATSLRELSFLVGEAPEECLRRSRAKQLCTWRLSSKMMGYRLVAATIEENRRVTLACFLAYDGTPRRNEDCAVELTR